jgi:hypothetical protein
MFCKHVANNQVIVNKPKRGRRAGCVWFRWYGATDDEIAKYVEARLLSSDGNLKMRQISSSYTNRKTVLRVVKKYSHKFAIQKCGRGLSISLKK